MTFAKAKILAQQGKMLSRRGWDYLFGWHHITSKDGVLYFNDPMNGCSEDKLIVSQWVYTPSQADMDAKDWEVIEKIRKWRCGFPTM